RAGFLLATRRHDRRNPGRRSGIQPLRAVRESDRDPMNAWKPILAALVIFAAGVVTGGLTVTARQPRLPHPEGAQTKRPTALPREGQLRELSRRVQKELGLTPVQREQIEAIIHESQD